MSKTIELPFAFFQAYCHGFYWLEILADADDDFDLMTVDLDRFKEEAASLRERAAEDGVLDELRPALEYLISIEDDDIPISEHHPDTVGALISPGRMSGFDTPELHRLFEWARAVNFPELPPMTDEDKAAAKKGVRPVEADLDAWMEARGLERGSKPGVWAKRQEAAKRKREEQP